MMRPTHIPRSWCHTSHPVTRAPGDPQELVPGLGYCPRLCLRECKIFTEKQGQPLNRVLRGGESRPRHRQVQAWPGGLTEVRERHPRQNTSLRPAGQCYLADGQALATGPAAHVRPSGGQSDSCPRARTPCASVTDVSLQSPWRRVSTAPASSTTPPARLWDDAFSSPPPPPASAWGNRRPPGRPLSIK